MNARYVLTYDDQPDLSYLDQTDEHGQPLFDLDPNDVVSYVAQYEKRCECCGHWNVDESGIGVLGGCDVVIGSDDDIGPGVYEPEQVPKWIREHFETVRTT